MPGGRSRDQEPQRENYSASHLILAEGNAESRFIVALLEELGIRDLQVIAHAPGKGGFTGRLDSIYVNEAIVSGAVESILLIRDVDNDWDVAWREIQAQIRGSRYPYPVPTAPATYAPSASNLPATCVYMLPGERRIGCLETLLMDAMAAHYPNEVAEVDRMLAKLQAAPFGPCAQDKARIACLTAVLCETDPSASVAYIWSKTPKLRALLRDPCIEPLVSFLRDVPNLVRQSRS